MSLGRTLVMGDIHGNLSAYEQCMERCRFDYATDLLIQLGDVSDRHPHTAAVVEDLLKVNNLIAIRGNHDTWTLDWLVNNKLDPNWFANGGNGTVKSYKMLESRIDIEAHKNFFINQRGYHIDERNRLFIHAGFTHHQGPASEENKETFYWDRGLWANALSGDRTGKKPAALDGFEEIYIGHTPTLNWSLCTPMSVFNIWNIDTGAGTTGPLTIMDIDTKEYWQSD